MRNPFDLVCILASEESWCSRIHCTTCRCCHFRYAFYDLAKGKSPEDKDWVVHADHSLGSSWLDWQNTHEHQMGGYTEEEKEVVMNICADADIDFINANCNKQWPSYFHLMLHFMLSYVSDPNHVRRPSDTCRLAATRWVEQLKELVPQDDGITYYEIENLLDNVVSIRDGRDVYI